MHQPSSRRRFEVAFNGHRGSRKEAASYAEHAGAGELHLVAGTPGVAGLVTTDEMVSVYDQISISAYRAKKKHALMARATMRCELAAMR